VWAEYGKDGREQFYRDCADSARAYLHRAIHPETGLNPDYSEFSGKPFVRWRMGDAFRFDSWRVPMNIAMDYSWYGKDKEWQKEYAVKIQNFLFCQGINTFVDQYTVDGKTPEWILPAGKPVCRNCATHWAWFPLRQPRQLWEHKPKAGNLSMNCGMLNLNHMKMDTSTRITTVYFIFSA
jgi:hypothetical protein